MVPTLFGVYLFDLPTFDLTASSIEDVDLRGSVIEPYIDLSGSTIEPGGGGVSIQGNIITQGYGFGFLVTQGYGEAMTSSGVDLSGSVIVPA